MSEFAESFEPLKAKAETGAVKIALKLTLNCERTLTLPTLAMITPIAHPRDLAEMMADYLIALRANRAYKPEEAVRLFAAGFLSACAFHKNLQPVDPHFIPFGTDFLIDMSYSFDVIKVGDIKLGEPKLTVTAYRPIETDTNLNFGKFPTNDEEFAAQCRGVLSLRFERGVLLIDKAKGWIGSNETIEYLRDKYSAAVAKW